MAQDVRIDEAMHSFALLLELTIVHEPQQFAAYHGFRRSLLGREKGLYELHHLFFCEQGAGICAIISLAEHAFAEEKLRSSVHSETL